MARSGILLVQAVGLLLFWAGWLLAVPGNALKTIGERLCDLDREG